MHRAISSVQASRSAAVYPTTVGLPCVPLDAWTRASAATGTRRSPKGYASRSVDLSVNGRSASRSSESSSTSKVVRRRSSCSRRSSARGSCSARLQITVSESSLVSAPVLFEVAHERGAEMAVDLLAAERRHVLPEEVERLCPDSQCAPVAGGVHEPGARERVDASGD